MGCINYKIMWMIRTSIAFQKVSSYSLCNEHETREYLSPVIRCMQPGQHVCKFTLNITDPNK